LAWLPKKGGKASCGYRLHAQFEVFRGVPSRLKLTGANPKGAADERVVLEQTLSPGRCYLMDRGYEKYALFNAIHRQGSNYVARLRDNPIFRVLETRELTDEDRQAGVLSDQLIELATKNTPTPPDHPQRLVIVKVAPHSSRTQRGTGGPDSDGYLRIVTDVLDVPAEIIAALYQLRWTIEVFFRMIKQLLGCRHLLSTKPEGVTLQLYMAIIACILILAITGRQPTQATLVILSFYIIGLVSDEELLEHLEKLRPARD
jgi:hypothetical protein